MNNIKSKKPAPNRSVYASPPSAARATKNGSRVCAGARTPFVPFFSTTFFCARKNASHFSLSGAKNVTYRRNVMCNGARIHCNCMQCALIGIEMYKKQVLYRYS